MALPHPPSWMKPHLKAARRFARPLPRLKPRSTALIAVDCQNYFLHREGASFLPQSEVMGPRLAAVIEALRRQGSPVFYTAHGHRDPARDGGMLGQWWGGAIREGSWEAQIHPSLAPAKDERLIRKRRYSAFVGTDLEAQLAQDAIDTVIIGGVMTNLCCETTARDAFCRDFRVVFLADGTATSDEAFHGATLLNLAFGFAHVQTCAELLGALREGA